MLDVGAGPGAASLALARRARRITAVDQSQDALTVFDELASREGLDHAVIVGTWPDVAGSAPVADVVVCNPVLYNVADLEPFVRELSVHARRRVVTEITAEHPRAEVNELWKRTTPPSPAVALPILTFTDGVTLHLNGDDARVVHVPPAHTDGDADSDRHARRNSDADDFADANRHPHCNHRRDGYPDGHSVAHAFGNK